MRRIIIRWMIGSLLLSSILTNAGLASTIVESELVSAAHKGNLKLVKELLGAKQFKQEELNNAFIASVKKGNPGIVELFLQAGADINIKNDEDYTPLMQAAHDGRDEIITLLLNAGVDINAVNDEKDTALMLAAAKNRKKQSSCC